MLTQELERDRSVAGDHKWVIMGHEQLMVHLDRQPNSLLLRSGDRITRHVESRALSRHRVTARDGDASIGHYDRRLEAEPTSGVRHRETARSDRHLNIRRHVCDSHRVGWCPRTADGRENHVAF